MVSFICRIKKDRNKLIYKMKETHRQKTNLWLPKEKVMRE